MALLFADSVDHYNTDFIEEKYDAMDNATVVAGGRCSTNCLRMEIGPASGYVIKGVGASGDTVICGAAFKSLTFSATYSIFTVYVGSTPMFVLSQGIDSSILGTYNPDAAFAGPSIVGAGGAIPHDDFYFVEMKLKLHDTAGELEVQVDGVSVFSVTGVCTSIDGSVWTGIKFGGSSFGGTSYYDDLYICDTSGSVNNDFLGDVRVEALEPTANGAVQQWDLGAGSSHWSAVDDGADPDEDTSYISTSVLNEVETNIHEDSSLPSSGTVHAVQVTMLAKKDQPGNRTIAAVTRQGGTNYVGDNLSVNQDNYTFRRGIFETNPATSAAWTITEVNDSEYGVKVTN